MSGIQKDRNEEINQLRKTGKTFREIGLKYSLSAMRIKFICDRFDQNEKERNDPNCWWSGLSVRAKNCLINAGIVSRDEAMEAAISGRLNPRGSRVKNYGWKSHKEVFAWLGLSLNKWERPKAALAKVEPVPPTDLIARVISELRVPAGGFVAENLADELVAVFGVVEVEP